MLTKRSIAMLKTLLFALLLSAPIVAEPLQLLQADGTPLHYYYDAPTTRGPLVLILQGSECRRVSDKYAPLIEQLQRAGCGVLRIEKPGLSPDTPLGVCPPTYLQRNTLERRIWDVLSVMGEMRKRPDWDGRLVLLGGSEGAMMAGLLAPLLPETRAVALISGGGGDTFAQEIDSVMAAQGASSEHRANFRMLCQQVHVEPTTTREWGSDGKLARNTHLWLSRAEDVAIVRSLIRVDCPILVVHGGVDRSTPLASARRMADTFKQAGKTNLELRVEPQDGHDPSSASLKLTLEWVVQRLAESR